jgi:hypothetical protein
MKVQEGDYEAVAFVVSAVGLAVLAVLYIYLYN